MWDKDACWRALERVADQLGNPPRFQSYVVLSTGRADLPSGPTVRNQLGRWIDIVIELSARRNGSPVSRRRTNRLGRAHRASADGSQSQPFSSASFRASARFRASSFCITDDRWLRTVPGDRYSAPAMSATVA